MGESHWYLHKINLSILLKFPRENHKIILFSKTRKKENYV